MLKVEKLALFDLDDTLLEGNSHIEVLNCYYRTKFFSSIITKIIGKISEKLQLKILYYFYNKIPEYYIQNFLMPFRKDLLNLLLKMQKDGFSVCIISNAPIELLTKHANYINVPFIHAEHYKKYETLKKYYEYNYLFVCTDNISDIDLLKHADNNLICCKKRKRKIFKKTLSKANFYMVD